MDRKANVIIATESQLPGLNVSCLKRVIQFDVNPSHSSLLAKASTHASVIVFFMRHEVLAVNVLQAAGVALKAQATELLPLQYNHETDRILSIEAVCSRLWPGDNLHVSTRVI